MRSVVWYWKNVLYFAVDSAWRAYYRDHSLEKVVPYYRRRRFALTRGSLLSNMISEFVFIAVSAYVVLLGRSKSLLRWAFSYGPINKAIFLLVASIVSLFGLVALLHHIAPEGAHDQDIGQTVYSVLYKMLNPGSIDGIVGSLPFVVIMIASIVVGLTLTSTLISIVNNTIADYIERVRTTDTRVHFNNHIVWCGWDTYSPQYLGAMKTRNKIVVISVLPIEIMRNEAGRDLVEKRRITFISGSCAVESRLAYTNPSKSQLVVLQATAVSDMENIAAYWSLVSSRTKAKIVLELWYALAPALINTKCGSNHHIVCLQKIERSYYESIARYGAAAEELIKATFVQYNEWMSACRRYEIIESIPICFIGRTIRECRKYGVLYAVGAIQDNAFFYDDDHRYAEGESLVVWSKYERTDQELQDNLRRGIVPREEELHVRPEAKTLLILASGASEGVDNVFDYGRNVDVFHTDRSTISKVVAQTNEYVGGCVVEAVSAALKICPYSRIVFRKSAILDESERLAMYVMLKEYSKSSEVLFEYDHYHEAAICNAHGLLTFSYSEYLLKLRSNYCEDVRRITLYAAMVAPEFIKRTLMLPAYDTDETACRV